MITDLPFTKETTQHFSYITTKLHLPSAPPSLVQRPRLMQQLNQSIQYKLLLVSAPAGFGKTTLLSDWSQRSEWPVAWVSLDAADNDPIHFWSYVITALDKLDAGLEHILDLLHATHTDLTYHLTGLINALAAIPDDFVLVLGAPFDFADPGPSRSRPRAASSRCPRRSLDSGPTPGVGAHVC